MAQYFEIHPTDPQPRLIHRCVDILREGGVIAYPTDSSYALGCMMGLKAPIDRIRRIRKIDSDHNFTLVCRTLADISGYAKLDNLSFRRIKSATPGPYTFILKANREVPRRLMHPKRRTIGFRIPDFPIVDALLGQHGAPIMSVTLSLPGDVQPLSNPHEIRERLEHEIDAVVDGGPIGIDPTTVIDFSAGDARILRIGKGDPVPFMEG